jgi:hypothetical protein
VGGWRRDFDDAVRRDEKMKGDIPMIRTGGMTDMNTKRRQVSLLTVLALFGVMLLVLAPAGRLAAEPPAVLVQWPDTIYVNAKIVTFDDTSVNDNPGSIVEAMAVRDQKIIALGSKQEILALKGPGTRMIDLQGELVLPGFVHSHNHIFRPAEEKSFEIFNLVQVTPGYYLNIPVERTAKETLAKVQQAVDQLRQAVDVGEDLWIGIELLPDTSKGFPSIATVSNLMGTADPTDAQITQEDLDRIVSDRMFQLSSAANIQGPGEGAKPNIWYEVTAGTDGQPKRSEVFEFKWQPSNK